MEQTTHTSIDSPPPESVIAYFPLDILERIFSFARAGPTQNQLLCAPLATSKVNHHWRAVSLGLHGFWSTVNVLVNDELDAHAAQRVLEVFISRSGPVLPLDIAICTDQATVRRWTAAQKYRVAVVSMCRNLWFIVPRRRRWRNMRLDFTVDAPLMHMPGVWPWVLDDMPMLEQLQITYPRTFRSKDIGIVDLSASQRLRTCRISGHVRIQLNRGATLSSLEHLQFDVLGSQSEYIGVVDRGLADSWFNVLRHAPNLQTLTVTVHPGLNWRAPPPFTTHSIVLPQLRTLTLMYPVQVEWSDDDPQYAFLNSLACPQLKALHILCQYCVPDPCLRAKATLDDFGFWDFDVPTGPSAFLHASGCALERLVIEHDALADDVLARTLALCTRLRHLHVRNARFADSARVLQGLHEPVTFEEDELFAGQAAGDVVLCPELRCLVVEGCSLPYGTRTSDIVEMLRHRWTREGSELTYFSFKDCGLEGFEEHPWVRMVRATPRYGSEEQGDGGECTEHSDIRELIL